MHFKTNTTRIVARNCDSRSGWVPLLRGGLDSGAGTAHNYFLINRRQAVCLSIFTELSFEEHPGLLYGDRVVVVALHNYWRVTILVLDQDASRTQALRLNIGGRKAILLSDMPGKNKKTWWAGYPQTARCDITMKRCFPENTTDSIPNPFFSLSSLVNKHENGMCSYCLEIQGPHIITACIIQFTTSLINCVISTSLNSKVLSELGL